MTRTPSAASRMTLDEAANFIANLDRRASDDARLAIDRTRKRIVSAAKRGKLKRGVDGTYSFGDLIGWALTTWKNGRELFKGLPANIRIYPQSIDGTKDVGSPTLKGVLHPKSLVECHNEIDRLAEEIMKRDIRISGLEARVHELEPDAAKTQHRRSKAKEAAKIRWSVEK
jgi:hypothetical protein